MDKESLTYDAQKLRSALALSEISTTTMGQIRSNVIHLDKPSIDKDVINETMKKAALAFSENLDKISKTDFQKIMVYKLLRSSTLSEEGQGRTDKIEKPRIESTRSGSLKGDQFIKQKQRGSRFASDKPRVSLFFGRMPLSPQVSTSRMVLPSTSGVVPKAILKDDVSAVTDEAPAIQAPKAILLTSAEAALFSTVLQECLDRLEVIQHIIPAPLDKRWDESYKTVDELYGGPDGPDFIFRNDMGLPPIVLEPFAKLQKDRTYAYNVIKDILREIKCSRTIDRLNSEMDSIGKTKEDKRHLEMTAEKWTKDIQQLEQMIADNNKSNEKEKHEIKKFAQLMSLQVDEAIFLTGLKLGYVERWERARLDQQIFKLDQEEKKYFNELSEISKSYNANEIICGEICTYLQTNSHDLENEINEWTSRYNNEFEQRQIMIDDLKEKTEKQNIELENLRLMVEREQNTVNRIKAEREEIKREEEYWSVVHRAAKVIQSLWKGYMVRHQLGEYKDLWLKLKKRKKGQKGKRKKKK
ncbi:dynein regulatory complex protein 9-like [Prorops nasuta]|uniref:dynein regulatory complex protein 9-like n=1 Tax=Prorops nasuta TaxID=863751 RepID=UPI0034CFE03A